jgi:hypothetical protein
MIPNPDASKNRFYWTFIVSILFIAVLCHFMVESAVAIAIDLGIAQAIV